MKKNIRLMYVISLMQGMVFYGPIATLYRAAQGVSVFQITLIESISLVLCLVLEIPWGVVADRIGYKKTMVFCCALYVASKVVFWSADGFVDFLAERVMLSVVYAGMSGVDISILYLSCKDGDSQRVFGIYDSLGTCGLLVAALVFSVFVRDNYSLAGGLTVISYGVAAIASIGLDEVKIKDNRRFSAKNFAAICKSIFANKRLLMFLVGVALLSETHQTITVFLNQLQYQRCGMTSSSIGFVYIGVTFAGLCAAYSSKVTNRLGEKRALVLVGCLFALACMGLAVTKMAFVSIGGILLLRVANSVFQPLQSQIQCRQVNTDDRATALSINAMLVDSVGAGTNLVFGALAQRNVSTAFVFGALLSAAGMGLCFIGSRNMK